MRHSFAVRRVLAPTLLAVLAVGTIVIPAGTPPGGGQLAGIRASAHHDRFNIAVWQARHAPDILALLTPLDTDGAPEAIQRYFDLVDDLRSVQAQLVETAAADSPKTGRSADTIWSEREGILEEMDSVRPATTRALRAQVGDALFAEDLVTRLPVLGERVFPPVSFVMERLPWVLVVSPRERIELLESIPLRPDLTLAGMEELERVLSARNLSANVERIGGLSTYPSLVRADFTYPTTLAAIAHEWVHHYLFFRPLGQRYNAGGDMTAINETVANIVGQEIAAHVLDEPPPVWRVEPPPSDDANAEPGPFSLNRYLRETRLAAEELLEQGRVNQAESYMEGRRLELARAHGYYIRRLNQAYFAFHGNYADQPGAVSPVYSQLIAVRNASGSLAEFVARVQDITAAHQLEKMAQESGVA